MNENIIQPRIETPPEEVNQSLPEELIKAGINLKNIEFLNYLGLKHEMFNPDVMAKIQSMADFLPTVDDLMKLDIDLGNPHGLSRTDKIYSHIQLLLQERELKERQNLINKEKAKYYV